MSRGPLWIDDLFKAIDGKDAERFASFISADGTFLFGNAPAVCGRQAIRDAVSGFFDSVRSLSHEVQTVSEEGAQIWSRGVVTYVRHDGSTLIAPFCNYFQVGDSGVRHYQIYVDASALYR